MNMRMLRDPMLYVASTIESFLFATIESFVGYFNLNMRPMQIVFLVLISVVGIFVSLFLYAVLSDFENDFKHDVERNTRTRLKQKGWKPPKK